MIKTKKSIFLCRPHFDRPIVFCFHHAGGNSRAYQKWICNNKVDFIPAELPGHGIRINEPFSQNIDDLSKEFAEEIAEIVAEGSNIEFSLFGHSLGAVIAFNVACSLKKYIISPVCLQVAGRHAPQAEDPSSYKTSMGKEALIEEIMSYGYTPKELIENEEYRNFVLPIMFGDYVLGESFKYNNQNISVPVLAYYGRNDMGADKNVMRNWKDITTDNTFHIKGFDGDHFFLLDKDNNFPDILADDMLRFTKNKNSYETAVQKTFRYERGMI